MIESGGDMQPHLPEGQASMNGFEQAADGILLGNLSGPFCRDSCCKGIGRNVVCDNTARIDNTVVTYSYARAYYDICPKSAVVSDFDRPGITEETFDHVAADHAPSFFRKHRIYKKLNLHEIMLLKLRSFGCLNKVNFYTSNYDLALEYVLDKYGIEYANGFTGFVNRKFDPKSLQMEKATRLVKIHGSVNWVFDETERVIKEIQPYFSTEGTIEISNAEHVLIYPTAQKLYQTYNAPYSELMRSMLDNYESQRNVIIVLGYRYADEHINEILFKAICYLKQFINTRLKNGSRMRLILLI